MAEDVKLTTDGMLLNWMKDVGESVKSGDIIAEVEADKATVEIEAPADGVILSLDWEVGEEKEEGEVIATIGADGEAPADDSGGEESQAAVDSNGTAPTPATSKNLETSVSSNGDASTTPEGRIKASPVARNIAEERGIDLNQVSGTGPGGRIVKTDVENFDPSQAQSAPDSPAAPTPQGAPVSEQTWGKIPKEGVEIEDISRMRRAIADATTSAQRNVPHFYITSSIDVEPLMALRKQINASLESQGIKVSVNDMLIKAAALTLRKYPNLNSHYYGDKIVRHQHVNIGVAVALPNNGLINVVAKDADKRALSDLAVENKAMYERARDGKIKPEDTRGGTLTISNLGAYDVDHFSAIISNPEAAILAIGTAKKIPVVKDDGTLGIGMRMNVTISIDHRVSDGAEGAEFMQSLKNLLEDPMRLLV